MTHREIKQLLKQGPAPLRLQETKQRCKELLREQTLGENERRTGFWSFLADVFRFTGFCMCGIHALVLLVICLGIFTAPDSPAILPFFVPLFAVACLPALFRGRTYEVSEMEAATRASGAQLVLAKLILAGAADLVGLSAVLAFAVFVRSYRTGIFQLILYTVVPFLFCMGAILWCMRRKGQEGLRLSLVVCVSCCLMGGALGLYVPWLYETSAVGFWMAALVAFLVFFGRELCVLLRTQKEGLIYGFIA